jgi:hypothetical protein
MLYNKEFFEWVNGFDGWAVRRSQIGFKYKAFLAPGRPPLETIGYAFYYNGCWFPYAGASLRKAERRHAADLREHRRRHGWEAQHVQERG